MRGGPIQRFESKIIRDASGCWLWRGAIHRATGYGRFSIDGQNIIGAHRAAWLLFRGEIPDGKYVCHACDVKACVNPDHLFIGDQRDNMRDATVKGRIRVPAESYARDERHQRSRLTNEQVREIRASPLNASQLHKSGKYPICYSALRRAKRGMSYADV